MSEAYNEKNVKFRSRDDELYDWSGLITIRFLVARYKIVINIISVKSKIKKLFHILRIHQIKR